MTGFGTHSPFAALHKSGSYWGVICRAFAIARPVGFDPEPTSAKDAYCDATFPSSLYALVPYREHGPIFSRQASSYKVRTDFVFQRCERATTPSI